MSASVPRAAARTSGRGPGRQPFTNQLGSIFTILTTSAAEYLSNALKSKTDRSLGDIPESGSFGGEQIQPGTQAMLTPTCHLLGNYFRKKKMSVTSNIKVIQTKNSLIKALGKDMLLAV